jgi:hypothetical protein
MLRKMSGTGSERISADENVNENITGYLLRKMFGTGTGRISAEENIWNWDLKNKY